MHHFTLLKGSLMKEKTKLTVSKEPFSKTGKDIWLIIENNRHSVKVRFLLGHIIWVHIWILSITSKNMVHFS